MTVNGNHIVADEGKTLRRKSDGWMCGDEIYLGYTYYINDEKLDEPLKEEVDHYEEVDKPSEAEETENNEE